MTLLLSFCKVAYEVQYLISKGIRDFVVIPHAWVSVYPAEARALVTPVLVPPLLLRDPRVKKAYRIVGMSVDDVIMTLEHVIASEKASLHEDDAVYFVVESPDMPPGQIMARVEEELARVSGEE